MNTGHHPEGRPRQSLYGMLGALLGTGAPLGYLALRSALRRRLPSTSWLARELSSQRATYGYLGLSTTAVFATFGRLLGRVEDQRRRRQQQEARLREQLSAVVSHDLRDPVTRILGEADRLLEEPADDVISVPADTMRRIRWAARRLAQVTDDFQDVMQIELGRLAIPEAAAAPVDLLRSRLAPHPTAQRVEGHPERVLVEPRGPAAPMIETVRRHMSRRFFTIDDDRTVAAAWALMREHSLHHLPVVRQGGVVGLLSDRDLAALERREDCFPGDALIYETMARFPFIVSPEAPVEEVVRKMADGRREVAIVVEDGKVVGILDALDALRAVVGISAA